MKVSNLPTQTSAQALDSLTKTPNLSRKDSKTEGVKSSTSVLFRILSSTPTPASKINGRLEDIRSERVSNLRGIQPYDFNRAVRANKKIVTADTFGEDMRLARGEDMLLASREPLQKETEHVARQIALWAIKHGADRDGTRVLPAFSDAKAGKDYLELAARIDQNFKYDRTKDRYLASSGLYVQPPSEWSSMKLDKHIIMRLCPMIDFEVQSLRVTGKIYADYFDHKTDLGKQFGMTLVREGDLAETDSNSSIDLDLLSQAMMSAESLFPSILNFMEKQYLEKLAAAENTPEMSRPPIVDCASEDESQRYVSQSSFDDGHWELTLPSVVLDQMEQSSKHSTDDPEVKQQFIFVQDLDGNLKLSIHQDKSYHHSTPEGGRPIRTAGELFGKVSERDGKLVLRVDELCNKSGHYWPTLHTFAALRDDLIASGLVASTLKFIALTKEEDVQKLMDSWSKSNLPSHVPAKISSLSTAPQMITTAHAELIGSKRNAGEGSFPRTESAPVQSGSNMEQLFPH